MSTYRDALDILVEELRTRQSALSERIAALTPVQRAVLSPQDRAALEQAVVTAGAHPINLEEVEALRAELSNAERATDGATRLASTFLAFGDPGPAVARAVGDLDGLGRWLQHLVAPWGGTATRSGDGGVAHVEIGGLPIDVHAYAEEGRFGEITRLRFEVVAQVPVTLGPIRVRPQRTVDGMAKALRLADEHEVGDLRFDDAYWVTGQPDAVRAVLSDEVRRLFCELVTIMPSLRLEAGSARLSWTAQAGMREIFAAMSEGMSFSNERNERTHTEQLVPPRVFELQRAIRAILRPRAPALERVISQPGSTAARRALADHWRERGDLRAALIDKQLELYELHRDDDFSSDRARRLDREVTEIITNHGRAYAGRVAELVDRFEFRRGVIAHVTLSGERFASVADELFDLAPIQHLNLCAPLGDLAAVFAVPQIRRLVTLEVSRLGTLFGDAGAIALAQSPHAAGLLWIDLFDDAIGEPGVEAMASSPHLQRALFINFERNLVDPTPVVYHYDCVFTGSRPPLAAELERRYGNRPWLAVPTDPEHWPPRRDAVAIDP